jgi:hypothetical protein
MSMLASAVIMMTDISGRNALSFGSSARPDSVPSRTSRSARSVGSLRTASSAAAPSVAWRAS